MLGGRLCTLPPKASLGGLDTSTELGGLENNTELGRCPEFGRRSSRFSFSDICNNVFRNVSLFIIDYNGVENNVSNQTDVN